MSPQPHLVSQYSKYMFGIDRFDQIPVGGKKWYWPAVTWLLNTGVHNDWQLHKKSGSIMKLLVFKRELSAPSSEGQQQAAARTAMGGLCTDHLAPGLAMATSARTTCHTSSRNEPSTIAVPWRASL
jgi:hypothetical protein